MNKWGVSPGKGGKPIKGALMRGLPLFIHGFNATGSSDELHRMHFIVVPLKDGEPGVSIYPLNPIPVCLRVTSRDIKSWHCEATLHMS